MILLAEIIDRKTLKIFLVKQKADCEKSTVWSLFIENGIQST